MSLFLLFGFQNRLAGQYLEVKVVTGDDKPAMFGEALLVSRDHDSILTTGNISGEFKFKELHPGIYKLYVSGVKGTYNPPPKVIRLKMDTLQVQVVVQNCALDYPIHACPVGKSARKVIRVDYNYDADISFMDEQELDEYYRNLQKMGYRSISHDGQEILIYVHDPQQNEILRLTNACDQYLFCKKHKITFRMN